MKKKTIEEVGVIVGTEGLGYALQDYLNSQNIENEELSILWRQAQEAMNKVENFLKKELGEDFLESF